MALDLRADPSGRFGGEERVRGGEGKALADNLSMMAHSYFRGNVVCGSWWVSILT